MQSISVFLDKTKVADFPWKNVDVSRTRGVFHVIYIFLDPPQVRYNCAKFHKFRICVTNFGEGELFAPSPLNPWAVQKRPILNRVEGVNEHIISWKNWPKSSIHEFSRISWITNLYHMKTLRNVKSTCEVIMLINVLDWWPATLLKMTLLRRQFFLCFVKKLVLPNCETHHIHDVKVIVTLS